jgi:hypothetical protein
LTLGGHGHTFSRWTEYRTSFDIPDNDPAAVRPRTLIRSKPRKESIVMTATGPAAPHKRLGSSDATTYANAPSSFKSDWTTVCNEIRSIIANAPIAGPVETHDDARLMGDFHPWAKTSNVLPGITHWHESFPGSPAAFEANLGADPAPTHPPSTASPSRRSPADGLLR